MGDDITIGVTEIVNNIEVTAQPNDQIVDISVIDNSDEVTLNITPTVIEVNVNKGSSYAKWGTILGTLSDQEDLQDALDLKANLVDGKVPASELPSYVDDVIEVADYASLPTTGEIGKIYITLDNNKIYRWSGSIYIEIASNNAIWGAITGTLSNQLDLQAALDAKQSTLVSGTNIKTLEGQSLLGSGNIDLTKSDVGLSNVDNTSDLDKPISTATQTALDLKADDNEVVKLTTDQSIAGVKTFTSLSKFTNDSGALFAIEIDTITSDALVVKDTGTTKLQIGKNGEILAAKYKISGGFNTQFLKANGDLDSTSYVPTSRTLTINGTTYDLSANRSWTINSAIWGNITGILSDQGDLQSALNGKQDVLTNPITGSLTTNYLPKATGANSLDDSLLYDNGTNVGIGTDLPNEKLEVNGNILSNDGSFGGKVSLGSSSGPYISGNALTGQLGFSSSAGSPSMVIDIAGRVGIGTVIPQATLDVNGANSIFRGQIAFTGTDGLINGISLNYVDGSSANSVLNIRDNANGLNRVTFLQSGNVGIGTISPQTLTHLYTSTGQNVPALGSAGGHLTIQTGSVIATVMGVNTNGNFYIQPQRINGGGSNVYNTLLNPSGGNVGIGTISPTYQLQLSTDSAAKPTSALWTIASDERIKENINPYTKGLNELLKINPITYDYNGLGGFTKGKGGVGIIAQEISEILPDSVSSIKGKLNETDEEEIDILNFNGHELTYILINAIKELKAEIELLKSK